MTTSVLEFWECDQGQGPKAFNGISNLLFVKTRYRVCEISSYYALYLYVLEILHNKLKYICKTKKKLYI